ncbi:MAG: hypothetical protein PVJ67_01285 [Candidatus Pacearchaeota archaeon]|jgi:hypothetical protein
MTEVNLEKLGNAERYFCRQCKSVGLLPNSMPPKAKEKHDLPYDFIIPLSWPFGGKENMENEINNIIKYANETSQLFRKVAHYEGLHPVAGGALAIYLGFENYFESGMI